MNAFIVDGDYILVICERHILWTNLEGLNEWPWRDLNILTNYAGTVKKQDLCSIMPGLDYKRDRSFIVGFRVEG